MEIKRISKWVLIFGTVIILAVKSGIRPYWDCDQPMKFILGIAPNLVGSFLIPFAACWFFSGRDNLLARIFRIHSLNDLKIVCMLGLGMLIVNEYLQRIPFFGRTFDYFDIVFSVVGLALAYLTYLKLFNRFIYRYYPD
jgi:hypothetical protein